MKKKNVMIIVCVVLLLIGIGVGSALFLLNRSKNDQEPTNEINNKVVKEEVEVEVYSSVLEVSDFFVTTTNVEDASIAYFLNDEEVSFSDVYNKIGEFKVVIKDKDTEYQTILQVIDKESPQLEVQEVTTPQNSTYEIANFVVSCVDNSKEECILEYKDNAMGNYQEIGEYPIVILAKDQTGNAVQKETKLTITKDEQEPIKQNSSTTNNASSNSNTSNNGSSSNSSNSSSSTTNSNSTTNNPYKSYYTKTRTQKEDFKYGVKAVKEITDYYRVKQDNSEELYDSRIISTTYDYSSYNGTTATLKLEAIENASKYSGMANEVVSLVNELRTSLNKSTLSLDSNLTTMAMIRAMELSYGNTFSHDRPDGSSCFTLGYEFGQLFYAENIAHSQSTPNAVFTSWKNSSGHYQNMIGDYTKIGIGINYFNGRYYWVQVFGY